MFRYPVNFLRNFSSQTDLLQQLLSHRIVPSLNHATSLDGITMNTLLQALQNFRVASLRGGGHARVEFMNTAYLDSLRELQNHFFYYNG